MRPLLLILTLAWGLTSHGLDQHLTFSSGDLLQVNSPSGTGLFGYKNPSATPNGSNSVFLFAENTKLSVLESKVIPRGAQSLVWIRVIPFESDGIVSDSGVWIIGATIYPGADGSGAPASYVTKFPDKLVRSTQAR